MAKPPMRLQEFQDRVLLETWLFCGGDLAKQFDGDDVVALVLKKNPGVPRSWAGPTVTALEREGMITRYSQDQAIPEPDDGYFHLAEKGLRWAEENHGRFEGYRDFELEEAASTEPEPTYLVGEDGARLTAEDGSFIIARDGGTTSFLDVDPQIIPTLDEVTIDLDRKRSGWDRFAATLRELADNVRGHNGFDDFERAEADRVVAQLEAGATLVQQKRGDVSVLKTIVLGSLAWIAATFTEGFVGEMGTQAAQTFTSLLGM